MHCVYLVGANVSLSFQLYRDIEVSSLRLCSARANDNISAIISGITNNEDWPRILPAIAQQKLGEEEFTLRCSLAVTIWIAQKGHPLL